MPNLLADLARTRSDPSKADVYVTLAESAPITQPSIPFQTII